MINNVTELTDLYDMVFSLKVYRGTNLLVDSGDLYDGTITGGKVGVFQFGEFPMIWSNLRVDCLEHTNHGLHFDGVDDFVQLDDAITIGLNYRCSDHYVKK